MLFSIFLKQFNFITLITFFFKFITLIKSVEVFKDIIQALNNIFFGIRLEKNKFYKKIFFCFLVHFLKQFKFIPIIKHFTSL